MEGKTGVGNSVVEVHPLASGWRWRMLLILHLNINGTALHVNKTCLVKWQQKGNHSKSSTPDMV